jgi:hypothetical protein
MTAHWSARAASIGLVLCTLHSANPQEPAPPRTIRLPQGAALENLIDAAFPLPQTSLRDGDTEIVVRFRPSCHPESQLEVMARSGSPARLRYARATVALQEAAARAAAEGDSSEAAVLKAMRVRETSFTEPPRYRGQAVRGFWKALGGSAEAMALRALSSREQLDGTLYKVLVRSGSSEVSFTLLDDEVGTPDHPARSPIVRWMNALRREAEPRLTRATADSN